MTASSDSPSGTPTQREAGAGPEGDLAQALRDLARGEQAATAMEANLTTLESKLDALLAAFDSIEEDKKTGAKSTSPKTENDGKGK